MTIMDQEFQRMQRESLRKTVSKINEGDMLTLDELNDTIYVLGCLVDDLITVVESWKNVVESMVVKR